MPHLFDTDEFHPAWEGRSGRVGPRANRRAWDMIEFNWGKELFYETLIALRGPVHARCMRPVLDVLGVRLVGDGWPAGFPSLEEIFHVDPV